VAVVVSLWGVAPAWGQLPPTDAPLPGSSFQGADGDQDDSGALFDWQGLLGSDRVRHNPDEGTAFAGGSKETEPGEWELESEGGGVDPAKSNILDAYSAVDQPAAATFLYLAFTREAPSGTSFLTFELNRDGRLWDNGRARIPCRRTGDVQIAFEPQGNTVSVAIRRWITTATDLRTGCATTGRLEAYSGLEPNVDAQAAMSSADIVARLPGTLTGRVPAGQFGEVALNLAALVEDAFGDDCLAFTSVWMHSRSADSITSNLEDYVAPRSLPVRTCAASGTKFFDADADGRRDPGERGIPRFVIWADYDDDGVRDAREPFSVTDRRGRYVIHDIRPPDGTYLLRERLLRSRSRALPPGVDWVCSYPNDATPGGTGSAPGGRFPCGWGPIDVESTPNARGRDFGNWFPARLTVTKRLFPPTDPGRFDLLVNGRVVVAAAGDGGTATISVPPGTYTVTERAAAGTDPAAYRTSVGCRRDVTRFERLRPGSAYEDLALTAGQSASCTFVNVRPGSPAIAISKRGPAEAEAGETLRYDLLVSNPGDLSFAADAVVVTDPQCDDPPERVSTQGDATPGSLDPGDTWIYRCSRATAPPGDDCEPTRVSNTAAVSGTAGAATVTDEDEISTALLCPDAPPPLPPDPPGPPPIRPPGPRPPDAGDAGVAGLAFARATRRCLGRLVPRVDLRGARIARVRVFVNGRLRERLTLRTLQRRVRPRVALAPGRRYRVVVRVTFQAGSGTPPLTLRATVRTCARPGSAACPAGRAASARCLPWAIRPRALAARA
jgi:hypothetical protein